MTRSPSATTLLAVTAAIAGVASPLSAQASFGQTFTAPSAPNTTLQAIAVGASGYEGSGATDAAPFVASIFAFDGASGVGPSLFSQVLGPRFAGFALAPHVALAPGAMYVLVVRFTNAHRMIVSTTAESTYEGGGGVFCNEAFRCAPLFAANPGRDIAGFGVQFGPTASVAPEPGTSALLGAGLLAIAGVAARRRRTG